MKKNQLIFMLLILLILGSLFACNKPNISIKFVVDGEIYHTYNSTIDSFLTKPNDPIKADNTFLGWFKDENFTQEWDFEKDKVTNESTIYAKWVPNSDLAAAQIINSGNFEISDKVLSVRVSYNVDTFSITNNIEVSTYASYKIYKDVNCTEEVAGEIGLIDGENNYYIKVVSKDLSNADIYTAKIYRKQLYSVVFKYNSGQSDTVLLVEEGNKLSSVTPDAKLGYTFVGWGNWNFAEDVITENTIFNAIWTPDNYSIIYNNTYGLVHNNPDNFTVESDTINLAGVIGRTGYTFLGWYTAESGGEQVVSIENGTVGNKVLYARWQINNYKLEIVGYDGSIESTKINFGDSLNLDSLISSRSGYSFVGFYFDILNNNPLDITVMPAYDVVLYQKWVIYNLNLTYDKKTAISINDTIDAKLFNASVIDTDGENLDVTTVVNGEHAVGNIITVRLTAAGKYGVTKQATISDIRVYGDPTLEYNTYKDYFSLTDNLDAYLWIASGKDSFGNDTTINVYVEEPGYKAGDIVTIVIKSIDPANNITKAKKTGVKVYGKPIITYNTEKTAITTKDYINNKLWNVSAVDSFGGWAPVYTSYYYDYEAGDTIEVQIQAYDYFGNENEEYITVKVYGTPNINDAAKTDFKADDDINLESLGITAEDSFNGIVADIQLTLISGEQSAGQQLVYTITAIDFLGNATAKDITVKVYGFPDIVCGKTKISDTEDLTKAETFGLSGKDSFDNSIEVLFTLKSGLLKGGQIAVLSCSAADSVGNTATKEFTYTIYSKNDITINYYPGASDVIKLDSKGEEFIASATDSFGNPCEITVVAEGGALAGGSIANIKLRAADALGNTKDSGIISNIKVYGIPTITCTLPDLYLRAQDDISLLFTAKDSFGEELGAKFTTLEETEALLTVRVEVIDAAGNAATEEFEINKLQSDQSCLYMYIDNQYSGSEIVTLGSEYSLKRELGYSYIWKLNTEQITDFEGKSLNVWTRQGLWYKVYADVTLITYKITYNLDGGLNNVNNPFSYTVTDLGGTEGTIDLIAPAKADKKEFTGYEYLVTNQFNNTFSTTAYTFEGWYKEAAFNTKITIINLDLGDATLYAKWIENISSENIIQSYARVNADKTPSINGKYILFGEFPQGSKKNDVTITDAVDSRGFYLGSDGYYYAGYKESYFKVEPIMWQIIQESDGTAFLFCTSAITRMAFDKESYIYENSNVRSWLNNNFYDNFFSNSQKQQIKTTTLENDVNDNIFMLSHGELLNTSYGFDTQEYDHASRQRNATDYYAALGGWVANGKAIYWTRSYRSVYVAIVSSKGNVSGVEYTNGLNGVVPALKIEIS